MDFGSFWLWLEDLPHVCCFDSEEHPFEVYDPTSSKAQSHVEKCLLTLFVDVAGKSGEEVKADCKSKMENDKRYYGLLAERAQKVLDGQSATAAKQEASDTKASFLSVFLFFLSFLRRTWRRRRRLPMISTSLPSRRQTPSCNQPRRTTRPRQGRIRGNEAVVTSPYKQARKQPLLGPKFRGQVGPSFGVNSVLVMS